MTDPEPNSASEWTLVRGKYFNGESYEQWVPSERMRWRINGLAETISQVEAATYRRPALVLVPVGLMPRGGDSATQGALLGIPYEESEHVTEISVVYAAPIAPPIRITLPADLKPAEPEPDGYIPNPVVDEMYDCYQALANTVLFEKTYVKEDSYEMGYLDGWADAMNHAACAVEGNPPTGRGVFELFANRQLRRKAKRALLKQRARTQKLNEPDRRAG